MRPMRPRPIVLQRWVGPRFRNTCCQGKAAELSRVRKVQHRTKRRGKRKAPDQRSSGVWSCAVALAVAVLHIWTDTQHFFNLVGPASQHYSCCPRYSPHLQTWAAGWLSGNVLQDAQPRLRRAHTGCLIRKTSHQGEEFSGEETARSFAVPQLAFLTAIRRGCRKTLTGSAERESCTSDLWLLACGGPDRRGFRSKTNKIAGDATYRRSKSCGSEHPDQAFRGIAHNVSWHMRALTITRSTYFAVVPRHKADEALYGGAAGELLPKGDRGRTPGT